MNQSIAGVYFLQRLNCRDLKMGKRFRRVVFTPAGFFRE